MNEQIVWQSTLDDRYEVQVVRVAPYQGKLLIREAGEEIYSQRVGLMFDSLVGPVAADLDVWEEMAHACGHRPGELMQSKDLFKKCFDLKELVECVKTKVGFDR
jgi:hypothetical protein